MITQAKVDLAVLLKLFQHSERGGGAERPNEVANLFNSNISMRRVELALQTLETRGEVDREYHPHYADEGLWQISREGLRTVERALKQQNSFIARLAANGDEWLQSEDAQNATLSKNPRYEEQSVPDIRPSAHDPTQDASVQPKQLSIDWGKWGAIAGIAALPLALLLWFFT